MEAVTGVTAVIMVMRMVVMMVVMVVIPAGNRRRQRWWSALSTASLLAHTSPATACVANGSFSRGGFVTCGYERLRQFPSGLPGDTTSLDLSNNLLSGDLVATELSSLPGLVKLWLSNNELRAIPNGTFRSLSLLQLLDLQNNRLVRVDAEAFVGLSSLQLLYLQNNRLMSLPAGTLDHLKNLRQIHLYNNMWDCDCHGILYLSRWIGDNGGLVINRYLANEPMSVTCSAKHAAVIDVSSADNFTDGGCDGVRVESRATTTLAVVVTMMKTTPKEMKKATASAEGSPSSNASRLKVPSGALMVLSAALHLHPVCNACREVCDSLIAIVTTISTIITVVLSSMRHHSTAR